MNFIPRLRINVEIEKFRIKSLQVSLHLNIFGDYKNISRLVIIKLNFALFVRRVVAQMSKIPEGSAR